MRDAGCGMREGLAADAANFLYGAIYESSGKYYDLRQLWFSGLSLTSARPGRDFNEISGCGVRGAGRCAADAARFFDGDFAQAGKRRIADLGFEISGRWRR